MSAGKVELHIKQQQRQHQALQKLQLAAEQKGVAAQPLDVSILCSSVCQQSPNQQVYSLPCSRKPFQPRGSSVSAPGYEIQRRSDCGVAGEHPQQNRRSAASTSTE